MAIATNRQINPVREPSQAIKKHPWRQRTLILLALAGLVGLWIARQPVAQMLSMVGDQAAVSAYLQSYGIWGPIVLILVQIVQVLAAFIPGHVFLIAAGYVYGFPLGFILNLASVVAASQLAYALARWAGRPFVSRLVSPELLHRWEGIAEEKGLPFFTIAFVLPMFPTDAMNFVAGLSGLSPRKFLAANILGRLPSAVILTLIGSHALKLSRTTWGLLAALVIIVYILGRTWISRIERHYRGR